MAEREGAGNHIGSPAPASGGGSRGGTGVVSINLICTRPAQGDNGRHCSWGGIGLQPCLIATLQPHRGGCWFPGSSCGAGPCVQLRGGSQPCTRGVSV